MIVLSAWSDNAQLVMIGIGGVLLLLAAILALVRMSRGPTTLDRAVASDLVVGITIVALAMEEVVHRHVMTVPIMLVLALVGFAGPVAIARFVVDPQPATPVEPIETPAPAETPAPVEPVETQPETTDQERRP